MSWWLASDKPPSDDNHQQTHPKVDTGATTNNKQQTTHQQPNTKQRTQERHIKSCYACVALVSVVWCAGGYWMSWRLAYDGPPLDNKLPTTNNQPNNLPPTSPTPTFVIRWILDVMAVGLRQPTNRQQTTNNNQPITYPT